MTYDEFKEITGSDKVTEQQYNDNYLQAMNVIDYLTRDFLYIKPLHTLDEYLQRKIKLAIALQVNYFVEQGVNTASGIASKPMSVTIGRTSVSNGRAAGKAKGQYSDEHIAIEAVSALQPTGLLYRGVGCL